VDSNDSKSIDNVIERINDSMYSLKEDYEFFGKKLDENEWHLIDVFESKPKEKEMILINTYK
jgi:hypothetical protein